MIDEIQPGAHLGEYEILRKLATGGMAEIYLARVRGTAGFEKLVVLKRILPSFAEDRAFVTMFLDEARLAATLRHPNIASVFDVGAEDHSYFFAMEYIHGQDARAIRPRSWRRASLPVEIALAIACGTTAALGYAHAKTGPRGPLGLVHRDVSPSNILVSYDGAVKLVDFGIARASSRRSETQTGILKGKVPYMSPEQCRGQLLDRRSDLFSLGIVLYELTTGVRPFRGDTDFETMNQIVNSAPPPPSTVREDYPQDLEAIIMRLLIPEPALRYQNAEALFEDLEELIADHNLFISDLVVAKYMREAFAGALETEALAAAPEPSATEEWGRGGVSPQAFSDTTRAYPDGVPSSLLDALLPAGIKARAARAETAYSVVITAEPEPEPVAVAVAPLPVPVPVPVPAAPVVIASSMPVALPVPADASPMPVALPVPADDDLAIPLDDDETAPIGIVVVPLESLESTGVRMTYIADPEELVHHPPQRPSFNATLEHPRFPALTAPQGYPIVFAQPKIHQPAASAFDVVLPFDPVDARSAAILDAIDATAPIHETAAERSTRRIIALLDRAVAWEGSDLETAVAAIDLAMAEPPCPRGDELLIEHRDAIQRVLTTFLGDPLRSLALARPLEELANVPLSPRAAFLLSRLDGVVSIEDLLDISGMPQLEAQRYLCQLFLRGVLVVT